MSSAPRTPRWLLLEAPRAWIAAASATVLTFLISTSLFAFTALPRGELMWLSLLMGWTSFALVHALFSWLAFRRLGGTALADALTVETHARANARGVLRTRVGRAIVSDSTPSWSVQLSLMALVGMGILVLNSSLRTPLLLAGGVLLVLASWISVWVMYAIQYARSDLATPSLAFPGGGERTFSDYLYVSLAVQSTFGTTDVAVETAALRRAVIAQGLVAFVFNTVIVAMLVSLLLAGL